MLGTPKIKPTALPQGGTIGVVRTAAFVSKSGYASTYPKPACGAACCERRNSQPDAVEVGDHLGRKPEHAFHVSR